MATETMRDYLISLGFKVDEAGYKKFTNGIETAGKSVVKLVATIQAAALTIGAGVAAFASNLEALYFASQRVGASATNLKALEKSAQNFGVASGEALQTVQSLARFLRENPGGEGLLQSLGVQTKDVNGNLRDTADITTDLGAKLAQMPTYLAAQYGKIFGISENMLLAMRNPAFAKELRDQKQRVKDSGFDQAAKDAHEFMVKLRELGTYLEAFGLKVFEALVKRLGGGLENFSQWFAKNGPMIADRVADILVKFLELVDKIGPAIMWLVNKLIELDKSTDGWSTKIIALIAVLNILTGGAMVAGVLALAGSFGTLATSIAGAGAASTGLMAALGKAGAAGASLAAGYGIGTLANNELGKTETGRSIQRAIGDAGLSVLNFLGIGKHEGVKLSTDAQQRAGASSLSITTGGSGGGLADSAFGKLIAKGEGDYNSVNRGKAGGYRSGTEDLEKMTVAEVMRAQRDQKFNAAGRYQIIKGTLADAVKSLGLSGQEKFDRATQDKVFEHYLVNNKRKAIADYISGKSDNLTAAVAAVAREWASVADPATGKSFYASTGNNKASISADQMALALQNTRAMNRTQRPAGVAAGTATGGATVQISQKTDIHVSGGSDPAATGRAVADEQGRVNENLSRNMQTAVS